MKKITIHRLACGMILSLLMLAASGSMRVPAASLGLSEICREFETAIQNKEKQAVFTTSSDYTLNQLLNQLSKAALNQEKLYTGGCTYQVQAADDGLTYTFWLDEQSFQKVKCLKSQAAAYKAALKALQDNDCSTKFYSKKSYYSIFMLMLQQHPEYNYNTLVWENSNGTYGYRISSELTRSELNAKRRAADKKADAFVKNKLKKGMTTTQKIKTIHDYVIGVCSYDYSLTKITGYEDSSTAYGALVKKKAVCQGYTAAFNLLALKSGIYSIGVCGSVPAGSHSWNYVRIGGKYRYVDCTWDETLQTGKNIRHDYLIVPKKLIDPHHTWDTKKFASKYVAYCKYLI